MNWAAIPALVAIWAWGALIGYRWAKAEAMLNRARTTTGRPPPEPIEWEGNRR